MSKKCDPGCPMCIENKSGRANHRGHWGFKESKSSEVRYGWLKKQAPEDRVRRPVAEGAPACAYATTHPAVVAFLSADSWPEDGSVRKTGTVMLMTEDGVWKAWVHDRHAGLTAFVSAESLSGLLRALEEALAADTLSWRRDKPYRGR